MVDNTDSPSFWTVENNKNDVILSTHFIQNQNICRLCANICDNVVPIFDRSDEKTSICAKLKRCLPTISVSENDMKPKHVCLPCISKLESCVSFVDTLFEADSKFELLLQNKGTNEFLMNGRTFPSNSEISWIPMKQEHVAVVKYEPSKCNKGQVDITNAELLDQLCQQRTFSQQIVSTPVSFSSTQNHSPNLTQDGAGHSILQNLLTQNTVSPQDVVVLVEVKCKDMVTDSNHQVMNKKMDVSQNMLLPSVKVKPPISVTTNNVSNQQTKIVDTNGHIRIINLSDFEGKFNQFDKIASSFITDSVVSEDDCKSKSLSNSATIVPFLKTYESDLLNMLKFDTFGTDTSFASSVDASKIVLKSEAEPATSISTSSILTSVTNRSKQVNVFACEICGKQFTRKSRLNAHVARHSSDRPHVCDKCDQRFITKWDLTLHLRIHSGEFSCEFCGKAFPARGKLERHRRTHTGERPFPCMLCDRAFSEKRNLRNHLKTHVTGVTTDSSKSSNVSDTTCSCWFLSAGNHDLIKNTCDMCRRRNSSNSTGASGAVGSKDSSTVS